MPSNPLMPDVSSYANPGTNKLFAAASNDPTAAFQTVTSAQQMVGQGLQNTRQQVAIDQETFNLHKAKLDALHQIYGSLVADPSMDNFNKQLSTAVQEGVVDPSTAKAAAGQVMTFGGDPEKLRQFALNGLNVNATHGQVLEQAYGTPGTVNTGGSTVPVLTRTGPNAGTTVGGGAPIANTLAPGQKTTQVDYVDPTTGAGKSAPVGTLFDDQGNSRGTGYSVSPFGTVARGGQPPAAGGQGGGAPAPATPISFGGPQAGSATPPAAAAAPPPGQGGQNALVTPNAQTMPVVSKDDAAAATARFNAGKSTAADRNLMRGYAVQNNIPLKGKAAVFEPQTPIAAPAVAGNPAAPASATAVPVRQPPAPATGPQPVQATGADAPPGGMAVMPGSDSSHLVRVGASPASPLAPPASPALAGVGSGGELTRTLSPGQSASIAAGANNYGALSSDVSAPNGVQQRTVQLRTALNALRGTNTGLGTAGRQQLVGYLSSLPGGLGKYLPGVDPDSATDYDIASKYLNAYALNTPGAARSDAGLSTAQSANANTGGMMKQAAVDVTLQNIGMENGKRALLNAFNNSGADPGTFGKFAAGWSQNTDPRAFALGDMTPPERAKLYTGLQGPAKTAFLATVKKGIQAGVLTPADLQGAAGNGQ